MLDNVDNCMYNIDKDKAKENERQKEGGLNYES